MGLLGAGAVLDTWSLVRQVTREQYRASNPPSATLRVEGLDAELLARARAMPEVREADVRRVAASSAHTVGGWRAAVLFALDAPTERRIGTVSSDTGVWPVPDDAIVVEHSSVDFAGLAVGDSLELRLGERTTRRLPVVGIARDVGLAPGWMEHVVYAYVTPATLAELGLAPDAAELQIVVRDDPFDRDAIRRTAAIVQRELERGGARVTSIDVPVPGRHIHAGQIDSLLYTQGAFGVLALFASCFLVVNLISAMLTGQVREIGVMKTLGAGRAQVAAMYLGLALLLGIVAALVAVPAAALVGRAYADFTANLLNFSTAGFEIPRGIIALQVVVGLLLPMAAAAIPVLRGSRITVGEALRDVGIAPSAAAGASAWLSRARRVPRPLLLSLRNAFRRRQRVALTLATLALGGAVYLGALNLRGAVRGSVDLLFDTQRYDLVVRLARPRAADSLERVIAATEGVDAVEAWSVAHAVARRADGTPSNGFPISAPPAATRMLAPRLERGRWLEAGDTNAVVVNRRLADDDPAFALGSELVLEIGGRPTRWHVVGVVESGPSPAAFAPRETLAGLVGDGGVDRAVVRSGLEGEASVRDLAQRLRRDLESAGLPVQSTQLLSENRRITEDHLLMVAGFLGIMGQLMIVVGGLGLASTMSLAVLERTREIGVLRAIGARHRSIIGMVQAEGLVIAIASWVVAIPLSIPMSIVLGKAFGRIMLPVPVVLVPEMTGVMRWLAVVIVVSLVACLWPAIRATRIPTAAALAYE